MTIEKRQRWMKGSFVFQATLEGFEQYKGGFTQDPLFSGVAPIPTTFKGYSLLVKSLFWRNLSCLFGLIGLLCLQFSSIVGSSMILLSFLFLITILPFRYIQYRVIYKKEKKK
ncbi:hypothetical protein PP175_27845 (plasmid) [Aneurinibacillus sp. Ricciae_BoGa-3]|uniref:hypothetical protein n=1 Tax=Aneurinibacillus sp. Ricciae_BoGa-3 TaxID=3022697 RepID=UPI002340C8F1|nr:hypothetical protein [Aneurinibacillus sp. Ricciae_BoGa-3]WCK57006.1 hypothetical protein PP175_27845 [Aneurinibacillus sp. Ricciae_BoGa-3]